MPKHSASTLLCFLTLSFAGCAMNRPPVQSPDVAWGTYKGRLAEQCSSKHAENMPGEKLNELARDYYRTTDTQIQQLIELDVRRTCAKDDRAECFNTGFVQAVQQSGALNEFVKTVCSKS